MLRRVILKGRMLRRAFADSSEASDELALSKAGLIIPKATPKVSPFIKKGIFIAAPEQEKPAKENPTATQSYSEESGIVLERMGNVSSKPQRAHREPRIPRENKKLQPASTVALPTQAEQLDNKIPEYIFPKLDIAKTIEQADSSISFDKLKSIFSFSSTDQLKPYEKEFDNMIINDTNNRKARSEKAIVQLYEDYLRDFVSIEKLAQNRDLEPNFLREQLRLRSTMEKLKYKVILVYDSTSFKSEGLERGIRWLELSHLKGVTLERGYNPYFEMCVTDQKDAWRGLVRYKYDIHLARENQYGANFFRLANNILLRTYVVVSSPYRLKITSPSNEIISTPFKRLIVAENNLYKPPFGAYFDKSEAELLSMYTPRRWCLSDVDGTMKGNPVLPKYDQLTKTFVF